MAASGGSDAKAFEAAFISEVFHSLSQPLTALHCTLDLALQRDQTLEQLRASVQTALDSAERLRQRLLLVRALNDAAMPSAALEPTDLGQVLRELHEDMSPLFEAGGRRFELDLRCSHLLTVRADKLRLTRALFVFVEYLFRYLPQDAQLSIGLDKSDSGQAEIRVASASSLPVSPAEAGSGENRSCELELLRRTVVASGGDFVLLEHTSARSVWLAGLPLV